MDKINEERKEIDKLDDLIMQLLNQRYDISDRIGNIKKATKVEISDTNREEIILNKTSKYSHYPQLKSVYMAIMNESKNSQQRS